MLEKSCLNPSDGSPDGHIGGPPGGEFLGVSLEESGCGANSWGLFEAF